MTEKQSKINRRSFLKGIGAAGLAPAVAGITGNFALAEEKTNPNTAEKPQQEAQYPQVPKRKFGKTGVEVSILGLGTMFNLVDNQIILRNMVKWGATYWDTANSYAGGNSELGIGKYLEKNPEARERLFIASKASGARTVKDIENRLQSSLKRMNTNYIDLYHAPHGASELRQFTDELKQWVESAKKRNLIRFFGFSTHKNMAKCLAAAAKLDWIDAIMTSYNFRLMQDQELQNAIEVCHQAGKAIIAMKTTGKTTIRWYRLSIETEADKKLVDNFLQRGFTEEQAALKLVLQDERISTAAVQMENVAVLTANVAAALDKTELTDADKKVFKEYAHETCRGYCAGCAEICDSALADTPYVSDIMRYLMYYNSYGDKERARKLFAQIPSAVRSKLLNVDYSRAEATCPQGLPIRNCIAEAVHKLA